MSAKRTGLCRKPRANQEILGNYEEYLNAWTIIENITENSTAFGEKHNLGIKEKTITSSFFVLIW